MNSDDNFDWIASYPLRTQPLLRRHALSGIVYANELLLDYGAAIAFIEDCRKSGLAILGMDYFRDVNEKPNLILGAVSDFSVISYDENAVELTASAAVNVLAHGLPYNARWVTFVVV